MEQTTSNVQLQDSAAPKEPEGGVISLIISASRRTDIPAHYGRWFMNRIYAGYFCSVNPFNTKQVKAYSLRPDDVDAIVFWTKDPSSFMKYLDELDSRGYNYYFQFTLNGYPAFLEPNLPPLEKRIDTFQRLASRVGKKRVIWRYDPIILSSRTGIDYHLDKILYLAEKLHGYTSRLTISFLDFYGKVVKGLKRLERDYSIKFAPIIEDEESLHKLCEGIEKIAVSYGLDVTTCAEVVNLDALGIRHGACIDAELIRDLFGIGRMYPKDRNQRKECLCAESVDVGMYNTCSFQCAYCYANYSPAAIHKNRRNHYPDSPVLVGRCEVDNKEILKEKTPQRKAYRQKTLFEDDTYS